MNSNEILSLFVSPDDILEGADVSDVAFLVVGDPLG